MSQHFQSTESEQKLSWRVQGGSPLTGIIRVPGDKSISHRSLMFGAIAEGQTQINGFLDGEDCLATRAVLSQLGVVFSDVGEQIVIDGVGLQGLQPATKDLYFGNAGTGIRLMAGLLAGQRFASRLIGDSSLMQRPMRRVVEPLQQMGASISAQASGCAPLDISPCHKPLQGIHYVQSIASAQVKSAILLAGLYADTPVSVSEPGLSRDHTERMLTAFGAEVLRKEQTVAGETMVETVLPAGQKLSGQTIDIPSDISSATFFVVAALITPGSRIVLTDVGINPTRIGVLHILQAMGGQIILHNQRQFGGEPVADIEVNYSELHNIAVRKDWVALAIDEFPAIFVAAACAQGEFVLHHAQELRVKESDRIAAMASGLAALGVSLQVFDDGMRIVGNPATPFRGGVVDSLTDHRIAMSFAVAASRASGVVKIDDCQNVATSFPNFVELCQSVGLTITLE